MAGIFGPLAATPEEQAADSSLLGLAMRNAPKKSIGERALQGLNNLVTNKRAMSGLSGIAQGLLQAGAVTTRPISNAEAMAMASQGASQRLDQYDQQRTQDEMLALQQGKLLMGAREAQASAKAEAEKEQFERERKLRDKFRSENKDLFDVSEAANRVVAAAQNPSQAGDLALIFNYMKMLDPGSVVRESEYATAENAGNVPERLRSMYNRLLTEGGRLSPAIRRDFVERAQELYSTQRNVLQRRAEQQGQLAQRYGLSPENIAFLDDPVSFEDLLSQPLPSPGAESGAGNNGLRPGTIEDGFRYRGGEPSDPNNWEPVNG